jgi:hypothetical protein
MLAAVKTVSNAVSIVAGSVQLATDGKVIRVHPIGYDRAKEHGAFATPTAAPANPAPSPRNRNRCPTGTGT